MKKKVVQLTGILFTLFLMIILFQNSHLIQESVFYSVTLWLQRVFPSLFPMFILSDVLVYFKFPQILQKIFSPITNKLFSVNGSVSYIFFMSMLCGTPSSAYITKNMYQNGEITVEEAEKALSFSFFSNPLFLYSMLSLIFPNDIVFIIKLIFIHYASNIVIGIAMRYYHSSNQKEAKHTNNIDTNLGETLTKSITKSMNTMLMILGTITIYIILSTLITKAIHLSPMQNSILKGCLEITQGLHSIPSLYIANKTKAILAISIISFGGLSIHTQIKSILSDTPISYQPFFYARIAHTLISCFATILL